jgi:hypothetical protein
MRTITRTLSLAAGAAFCAGAVHAQTCLGRPIYSTAPMQLGARVDLGREANMVGAEFGFGSPRGGFALVNAARATASTTNEFLRDGNSGFSYGGTLGYQADIGVRTVTQLCPYVSYDRANFDVSAPNGTLRRSELNAGMNIGWVFPVNSDVHLVPFAGLAYGRVDRSLDVTGTEPNRDLGGKTYTPGTLGLGVHLRSDAMLIGQTQIPFGLSNANPSWGFKAVFPIGRR